MDYKRIITDGYDGRQTTPYAAYFKQQAQIAKRDNFVEFVVFFNGCKTIINNCKNDIQSKYNEELSNYDYFIRLAKQGQARDNNGNLIIDAKELEKRIAQLENQRQDIFDMGINSNYRITIEVLQPDPQKRDGKEYLTAGYTFDIYDLTDISNGLLQAEQELTTAKQSESAKQLESNTNKENTDQPKRTI
ncbi:MAG: hypothetical protein LBB41_00450, partial [Prevotellaceae bacterium]|nr:hypothetical protein [Prevotellaceae bacterium]